MQEKKTQKTTKESCGRVMQGRRNDEAPTGGGRDWERREEDGDGDEEDEEG